MDRQQLLKRLDKAWVDFKASYAGLPEEQLMEPGVTGAWSRGDLVAALS